MSAQTRFLSAPSADTRSASIVAALFVGAVSGINVVIIENALAAVVFSGPAEQFLLQGTGLFLFGSAVICFVVALTSGYEGALSAPPVSTTMTLPAIVTTIAASGPELFPTTVAALIAAGAGSGLCFLLVGRFRLANLMQFIPYPVACGFLAGTGAAVCVAALSLMGLKPGSTIISELMEPVSLWKWVPGLLYAALLYLATKYSRNVLLFPASFVLATALYHLLLELSGISHSEAVQSGLLFAGMTEGELWPAFRLSDFGDIDWGALTLQFPNIMTVVLVTLICVVMNTSGVDLSTNAGLDWNREFKSAGLASLLSGLGGGPPGCLLIAITTRSRIFKAETRVTGVVAALVVGLSLILGGEFLRVMPMPVIGGLLFVTGFVMLNEWLIKNRRRLPRTDFGIVVLMIATIVLFGFLEGVGIGMLATATLFAVRLSRVDLVASTFTSRDRRSSKARTIPDQAVLSEEGDRVQAFQLRGYMFFGSAYPLVARLRRVLDREPRPACMLLDFSSVSGFDLSALNSLCRFVQQARAAGVQVALSAASRSLRDGLRRNLPARIRDGLLFGKDVDSSLEQCEDFLIAATRRARSDKATALRQSLLDHVAADLEDQLDRLVVFEDLTKGLRDWMEPRQYESGDVLIARGQPPDGLQLLAEGRASAYDSKEVRLLQFVAGDAIEPRAAFGPSSPDVSVIADEPCRTLTLTPEARRRLESEERQLIIRLYGYLLSAKAKAGPGPDAC
ncbi:MAG: SulP family inorganic anion transporter [Bryobacterales bacterium]|nr:SulP family inorganic anion transporter [Bryobacterales bacterium]